MIEITLPYPISTNRYYRTFMPKGFKAPVTTISDEAKAYKVEVAKRVRIAGIREPIKGRISFTLRLYPGLPKDWRKRMRDDQFTWDDTVRCLDVDNALKVILDSIKNLVITDDRFVRGIEAHRMAPDGRGARAVVTIAEVPRLMPEPIQFGLGIDEPVVEDDDVDPFASVAAFKIAP